MPVISCGLLTSGVYFNIVALLYVLHFVSERHQNQPILQFPHWNPTRDCYLPSVSDPDFGCHLLNFKAMPTVSAANLDHLLLY